MGNMSSAEVVMAVNKGIELMSESDKSWEDAAQ